MSISNLPTFYAMSWSQKDGSMTSDSIMYSDELSQTLNRAINLLNEIANSSVISLGSSNQGKVVFDSLNAPQKTTSQINAFASDTDVPNGAIWFDTDVSKLKVKTSSGTIETITSS